MATVLEDRRATMGQTSGEQASIVRTEEGIGVTPEDMDGQRKGLEVWVDRLQPFRIAREVRHHLIDAPGVGIDVVLQLLDTHPVVEVPNGGRAGEECTRAVDPNHRSPERRTDDLSHQAPVVGWEHPRTIPDEKTRCPVLAMERVVQRDRHGHVRRYDVNIGEAEMLDGPLQKGALRIKAHHVHASLTPPKPRQVDRDEVRLADKR